ncbi:alcohol dehydrogenase [Trichoderma austrokoningii]
MVAIPKTQTAATVPKLGGDVVFKNDYPVPQPGPNEILAKILYSGVCQSDLHTKAGTAIASDGSHITNVKLPHVGGHEGIGRIVALGPGVPEDIKIGSYIGVPFIARVCRRCNYCMAAKEQYCAKQLNHLHHRDGSFQEYIVMGTDYLAVLPDDIDPVVMGPILCAGVTTYKAVKNANVKAGDSVVIVGAGGGLGHLAVQYALAQGAIVYGVDGGAEKGEFLKSYDIHGYIDFTTTPDVVAKVKELTNGGADAAIVVANNQKAYGQAAEMLTIGGTLNCVGLPPDKVYLQTNVATIALKGLNITGNLVGSLKECLEAVEFVRRGVVKPRVVVRPFEDLPKIYDELVRGEVMGRIVVKIAKDE